MTHRLVDQRHALGDHRPVPPAAILIVEQHDAAPGIVARGGTGMLRQQERQQAHDLRLGRKQPQQQPRQPDRLIAQRRALLDGIAARRIAFVEHEIDHRRHRREPLAALHRARRLERHIRPGDGRLRPRDTLLHRSLRDEKGARDLLHRQPRNDAQRQRDLLRRRQLRMAADEQQPQDVVAIMRAVEPLGDLAFGVAGVGDGVFRRQLPQPVAAAGIVDAGIAPDHDEPGGGVARRAVLRPAPERAQAGVLISFLGKVEIAEITQQRAERLGPRRGQRGVDPGQIGRDIAHGATFPGRNTPTGRIS